MKKKDKSYHPNTARKERARILLRALKQHYPDEHTTVLTYTTPWELLVAVQLSAQCTDARVNQVTPSLFRAFPSLVACANAAPHDIVPYLRSVTYFNAKARNIVGAARRIRDHYGGEVPRTMKDMLTLPGVARKTANVVLGAAFGVVEGIAVDTHVTRFTRRFKLSSGSTPVAIERDLMELIPRREWLVFTYRVIAYGRGPGRARGYDPDNDPLVAALAMQSSTRQRSDKRRIS